MSKTQYPIRTRITVEMWREFVALAGQQQTLTGEPVSAAALVRRALREWLEKQRSER